MNPVRYPEVPQGVTKTKIFTFGVAFHFFVALIIDTLNLIYGFNIVSPVVPAYR